MTDRLFCHFGPYFAFLLPWRLRKSKFSKNTWRSYHFTHVYLKLQSYDVWFLSYGVWRTLFLSFWTIFCPFTNNLKNENFEKMKKMHGDIIILHKCTMNNNHMMHGSCDMKRDRQIFLSFLDIFCLFTWRYHHFTQGYH